MLLVVLISIKEITSVEEQPTSPSQMYEISFSQKTGFLDNFFAEKVQDIQNQKTPDKRRKSIFM